MTPCRPPHLCFDETWKETARVSITNNQLQLHLELRFTLGENIFNILGKSKLCKKNMLSNDYQIIIWNLIHSKLVKKVIVFTQF